jgi:hypothetical protein
METKSWSQRLKDGEKIQDLIFSVEPMGINQWLEKCKAESLSEYEEELCIRCADRFDRITFEVVSPKEFARQWRKTVRI